MDWIKSTNTFYPEKPIFELHREINESLKRFVAETGKVPDILLNFSSASVRISPDRTPFKDNNWTPVSERLPEPYKTVLVFVSNDDMYLSWMYHDIDGNLRWDDNNNNPTHWQPLPEPPAETKEE